MEKESAPDSSQYQPGDWVVHRQHGLGEIVGIEKKFIGDSENTYCKIKTPNVIVWLPVEKMNDEWLRPLASPDDIEQALEALGAPPKKMSDNLNIRRSQINKVDSNDHPVIIAELLRDLWALKKVKKTLSQVEEEALRHLTDCFLTEWTVSLEGTTEGAKQEFEKRLQIRRHKVA